MAADLFTDDLDALDNDALFAAIEDFAKVQPSEGWRHDFTVQWDDSALKTVAAFANTFGGILVVGVKKGSKDVACELLGVESTSEYKTRIASAIAANIAPVPSFSVYECHRPGVSDTRFCVVRIRDTKGFHLVTKKGLSPVYVRIEDQSLPANAEQLRRLVERERELPTLLERVNQRASGLRDAMRVCCGYADSESPVWYNSPRRESPTMLRLEMIAADATLLELDNLYENELRKFVAKFYPRFHPTSGETEHLSPAASIRSADFYEYAVYHRHQDYESRWRITAAGDIGFGTQIRYRHQDKREVWSVVDLARYVILFLRLSSKWWEHINYFGDGHLSAQLNVAALPIERHPEHGYYLAAFDPTYNLRPSSFRQDIGRDAISVSAKPGNAATTETKLTYSSCSQNTYGIATLIVNRLLRSLGHVADTRLLRGSIESVC